MNWITLLIAIFGAFGGLASVKIVVDHFTPGKIKGKIISRYSNLNADKTQTYLLYKVSILCQKKPFNLMQIKCVIKDLNGNEFTASAENTRQAVFTLRKRQDLQKLLEGQQQVRRDVPHSLLVSANEFLNNASFFPANENIVGYLYFLFEGDLDFKWQSTTFNFESFDGKIRKFKVEESDIKEGQLFFDDTIWQVLVTEEKG
jgi:hypothetical protein